MSEWESSHAEPHVRYMARLAVVLDMPTEELMAGPAAVPTLGDLRKAAGLTVDEVIETAGIAVRLHRSLETGKRVSDPPASAITVWPLCSW